MSRSLKAWCGCQKCSVKVVNRNGTLPFYWKCLVIVIFLHQNSISALVRLTSKERGSFFRYWTTDLGSSFPICNNISHSINLVNSKQPVLVLDFVMQWLKRKGGQGKENRHIASTKLRKSASFSRLLKIILLQITFVTCDLSFHNKIQVQIGTVISYRLLYLSELLM